jgi:hypothetical protein
MTRPALPPLFGVMIKLKLRTCQVSPSTENIPCKLPPFGERSDNCCCSPTQTPRSEAETGRGVAF